MLREIFKMDHSKHEDCKLQDQVDKLKKEYDELHVKYDEAVDSHGILVDKYATAADKIVDLKRENGNFEKENQGLFKELEAVKKENNKLQQTIDELKWDPQLDALRSEVENYKQCLASLNEEHDKLKRDLIEARSLVEKLENPILALDTDLDGILNEAGSYAKKRIFIWLNQ